jgi:chemotaxis protein CheD
MSSSEPTTAVRPSPVAAGRSPISYDQRANLVTVVVGGFEVSDVPQGILVTYALGSCVGVAMSDPLAKVAGLLHCQLPAASMNPDRARREPGVFADTGVVELLRALAGSGADRRRLKVKLAGAAQMLGDSNLFDIGRRNHVAVRKALWQHGLLVDGEQVGGAAPRTMYVRVNDGTVLVRSGEDTREL